MNAKVIRPPEPSVLHMLRHDRIQREKREERARRAAKEAKRRAEPFNPIRTSDPRLLAYRE